MTPTTRQAIAAAFRAAKSCLWDGVSPRGFGNETRYICIGLTAVSDPLVRQDACRIINSRLCGRPSLEGWLFAEAGVHEADLTDARVQAHRHAWLDQLIAEFEAPTTNKSV